MIQFEMKRFLSVARWDMTINKKFYMSQVACLLALAVSPVVFQYLLWWSSGSISIFDFQIYLNSLHFHDKHLQATGQTSGSCYFLEILKIR